MINIEIHDTETGAILVGNALTIRCVVDAECGQVAELELGLDGQQVNVFACITIRGNHGVVTNHVQTRGVSLSPVSVSHCTACKRQRDWHLGALDYSFTVAYEGGSVWNYEVCCFSHYLEMREVFNLPNVTVSGAVCI